jgi:hypothetical protein
LAAVRRRRRGGPLVPRCTSRFVLPRNARAPIRPPIESRRRIVDVIPFVLPAKPVCRDHGIPWHRLFRKYAFVARGQHHFEYLALQRQMWWRSKAESYWITARPRTYWCRIALPAPRRHSSAKQFSAAAIDAPLSLPAQYVPEDGWSGLLKLVDALPNDNTAPFQGLIGLVSSGFCRWVPPLAVMLPRIIRLPL